MSRDPLEEQEDPTEFVPQAPYEEFAKKFPLGAPYNLNPRRITANGPSGLHAYARKMNADPYVEFAKAAFHHGMSTHKKVSYVKSAVRIAGSIVGIYAFGTHPAAVLAFFLLGIAEVLGVIEEQFENE